MFLRCAGGALGVKMNNTLYRAQKRNEGSRLMFLNINNLNVILGPKTVIFGDKSSITQNQTTNYSLDADFKFSVRSDPNRSMKQMANLDADPANPSTEPLRQDDQS